MSITTQNYIQQALIQQHIIYTNGYACAVMRKLTKVRISFAFYSLFSNWISSWDYVVQCIFKPLCLCRRDYLLNCVLVLLIQLQSVLWLLCYIMFFTCCIFVHIAIWKGTWCLVCLLSADMVAELLRHVCCWTISRKFPFRHCHVMKANKKGYTNNLHGILH